MLLCTIQEAPKHPQVPTFDHVSGGGIKNCLIQAKCREFQELSSFFRFQTGDSPSGRRAIT